MQLLGFAGGRDEARSVLQDVDDSDEPDLDVLLSCDAGYLPLRVACEVEADDEALVVAVAVDCSFEVIDDVPPDLLGLLDLDWKVLKKRIAVDAHVACLARRVCPVHPLDDPVGAAPPA
jgi:hypothetical protein